MIIKNQTDFVSDEQIIELIALLGEEYLSLPDEIIITENLPWKIVYMGGMTLGAYDVTIEFINNKPFVNINETGVINVYISNIKKLINEDIQKAYFAGSLFHELRHAWQRKFKPDLIRDFDEIQKIPYKFRPCEQDAFEFSETMANNFKDRITEILDIKTAEWIYDSSKIGELVKKDCLTMTTKESSKIEFEIIRSDNND